MICTVEKLKDKEVVNLCDGKRMGYVCDIELDSCSGRVCALLLPGASKCMGIVRGQCFRIPWECIERIGDDIILVNGSSLVLRESK